jgi:hypothetical protein
MKIPLLFIAFLLTYDVWAQRGQNQLGLNTGPLLSRSLELAYERTLPNRQWSITSGIGIAFGRATYGEIRLTNAQTGERERFQQAARGVYANVGARRYLLRAGWVRPFVGTHLILSRYQTYNFTEFWPPQSPEGIIIDYASYPSSLEYRSGWAVAAGGSVGVAVTLSPRFDIDLGVQAAVPLTERKLTGSALNRVYFIAGVGRSQASVPLQGILAFKYRLGRP